MTEWILQELHVTGVKTSININTLNGNQKVSSTLVDGIMVSRQVLSTRDQIHWIKLPKLYRRKEIQVDPSEVATSLKLKKCHYLDCIAGKTASDEVSKTIFLNQGITMIHFSITK